MKSSAKQKTNIITKDTSISEVLEKSPEAAEILMEYGLMCMGCPFAGKHSIGAIKDIYGFSDKDLKEILVRINNIQNENKQ